MVKTAKVTKSVDEHPEYGRILRIVYSDGVKIYVTKKFVSLDVPKNKKFAKAWKKDHFSISLNNDELDI